MTKQIFTVIGLGTVLLMCACFSPAIAHAKVSVSVQVGLPPFVIPAPPGMIVIPGSYVYYPPDVDVDIFFYRGYWYRPHHGHWYRARHYNGPWRSIAVNRVPRAVIAVPHGFRQGPRHEHIPYGQVKKNWRGWERNRHWDRGRHEGAHKKLERVEHRKELRGEYRERRDFREDKHKRPERGEHRGKRKKEKREIHGR